MLTDAVTGKQQVLEAGDRKRALVYEIEDLEEAAAGKTVKGMRLQETCDVMAVMTSLRKEWNVKYPGEQW